VSLYRLFPSLKNAITIIQPAAVLHWHRSGFRLYWRSKVAFAQRRAQGGD
jgi:putative transposase